MKKIAYIAPDMEVVEMALTQMLCASDGSENKGGLSDEVSEGEPD